MRLFPKQLITTDGGFGLFTKAGSNTADLPIQLDAALGLPIHIVHSDPQHLIFLAGLAILQAWTAGIGDDGPIPHRQPVLLISDRPGRLSDAYLTLSLPASGIKRLSNHRRVTLYLRTGQVPSMTTDKASYWEQHIKARPEIQLHSLFPAYRIYGTSDLPHIIAPRESLGRNDDDGAALVITSTADRQALKALVDVYNPFLVLFDAHGETNPLVVDSIPTLIYHDSIFSPKLPTEITQDTTVYCLPDARFEQFCVEASLHVREVEEPEELTTTWRQIDGALEALDDAARRRRHPLLYQVFRQALRLRTVLLGLPTGIRKYETALVVAIPQPTLRYDWTVTEPLQSLESRQPEVAALGETEQQIFTSLLEGFLAVTNLLQDASPKQTLLIQYVQEDLALGNRVVIVAKSPVFAQALKILLGLPEPIGFGFPARFVTATSWMDLAILEPDWHCVVLQAFEPRDLFDPLLLSPIRRVTMLLSQNELRFVGHQFARSSQLFPRHPVHTTLLKPVHNHIARMPETDRRNRNQPVFTPISEANFEKMARLFESSVRNQSQGIVLIDGYEQPGPSTAHVEALLLRLEDNRVVLLPVSSHASCVRSDRVLRLSVSLMEPGDRLIVIDPQAREAIAQRILNLNRTDEMENAAGRIIQQWQEELKKGMERRRINQTEMLKSIQNLGSRRVSANIIGQWMRGDVMGPFEGEDILRIGKAVGSVWLIENWQRVARALQLVRSGQRVLGHQITRIIQETALGHNLAREDEAFLRDISVSVSQLRDAVTLLAVEAVSSTTRPAAPEQLGRVLPFLEEEAE